MNLKPLFLNYCKKNNLEINSKQVDLIEKLVFFYNQNFNKSFLSKIFLQKNIKLGFYLYGDVGVGKTMILNFFYKNFNYSKKRLHFNEFMINFHDFVFKNKDNKQEYIIDKFVNKLRSQYKLIYFDEFQVTNIVDAMILGNLFKKIFEKKIKLIFTSNIKINDLYKDGLQREQFLPFIKIMKNVCIQEKLVITEDYRKSEINEKNRFFYPLNEITNFKINKFFRQKTKNIKFEKKVITVKGRKININNYYDGIARFDFKDLCEKNLGAEDYIKIAENCNFVFIENIPNFNNQNLNQQQRFIILIDVFYEKKIPLMISAAFQLENISSSKYLENTYKRTISRLFELTSIKLN